MLNIVVAPTGYWIVSIFRWSVAKERREPTLPEFLLASFRLRIDAVSVDLCLSYGKGQKRKYRKVFFDLRDAIFGKLIDYDVCDKSERMSEFIQTSDGEFEVVPVMRYTGRSRRKIMTKGFRTYRIDPETGSRADAPGSFSLAGGGAAVERFIETGRIVSDLRNAIRREKEHFDKNVDSR